MITLLKNFDFISFLHQRFMLGQVDPWRRTDEGKPIYTLLVPVETALAECRLWSEQDISRSEFTDYLKLNDIYLFNNVDEFKKVKDNLRRNVQEAIIVPEVEETQDIKPEQSEQDGVVKKPTKRVRPTPQLRYIATTLNVSDNKFSFDEDLNRTVIAGKRGVIYDSRIVPGTIHVDVDDLSRRQFSAYKKKLSFMRLGKWLGTSGQFIVERDPTFEKPLLFALL